MRVPARAITGWVLSDGLHSEGEVTFAFSRIFYNFKNGAFFFFFKIMGVSLFFQFESLVDFLYPSVYGENSFILCAFMAS